jgi:hypothetical protein
MPATDIKTLPSESGKLTWTKISSCALGRHVTARRAMIDRGQGPPALGSRRLGISQGSVLYLSRLISSKDLAVMP